MLLSEKRIISFALRSRIVYLIISSVSNCIIPDHNAIDVFTAPNLQYSNGTVFDSVLHFLFGGLTHWDAQHFFHIAKYGYTYEHNLAFFPLYPNLLSLISKALCYLSAGWLTYYSSLILTSFCLNTVIFIFAALKLYELSVLVLKSDSYATKAALFYCVSPASIFFVAAYSETLFSFLVFSGMTHYAQSNLYQTAIFFGLATHTRSNGIINAGFLLHVCLYKLYNLWYSRNSLVSKKSILLVIELLTCSFVSVCPYIIFQTYSYLLFCTDSFILSLPNEVVQYGRIKNFILPTDQISWCNESLPLAYSYVQSHYWNVGFLKYYSIKQIPNFILALPVISIVCSYSVLYFKHYWRLLYLPSYIYTPHIKPNDWRCPKNKNLLPRNTFVFVVQALFLTLFCTLCINVQVTTRIICSSSPILYWIVARYFVNSQKESRTTSLLDFFPFKEQSGSFWASYLKFYFIIYCFVGIVLFSNNLPWT